MALDADYWPDVPDSDRPRKVVFDTLRKSDIDMLVARGYQPVLLRVLPRRTPKEDVDYYLAFMQGVAEGTVQMSKSRSEGLEMELKTRGYLGKKELTRPKGDASDDKDIQSVLNWGESRHAFTGNTTMMAPEQIQDFIARAQADVKQQEQLDRLNPKRKGKRK